MERRVLTVRGRVVFADETPAAQVWVAIVDADPDLDDLLGVGVTGADGAFRLSFTTEAFNQEPAERELVPELYLVLSITTNAGPVAVERRECGPLRFEADEDLGTLVLPLRAGEPPVARPGLRTAPGRGKLVRRLHLDDDIAQLAAREICPIVEQLTGWTGLLDGVRIQVVDTMIDSMRRQASELLGRSDFDDAELERIVRRARSCDGAFLALWEPVERTVYLNRPALERGTLDWVKVVLGHELVHVGQSSRHPEMVGEWRARHVESWQAAIAGDEAPPLSREFWRFMANIEGYAEYIEQKFLRLIYTHATEFGDLAAGAMARIAERRTKRSTDKAMRAIANRSYQEHVQERSRGPAFDVLTASKSSQYASGLAAYLGRSAGERPVAFDPALRPEPLLDPAVLVALIPRATLENCPTSQLALAQLYLRGEGIPVDEKLGMSFLRMAAEGGLPVAAHWLACLLPSGDPEELRWFRVAAEWGYPQAQYELARVLFREGDGFAPVEAACWAEKAAAQGHVDAMFLFGAALLAGTGVNADSVGALHWLKKAAELGNVRAMRTLATLYRGGSGVREDLISVRFWTKRADAADAAEAKKKLT